MKNLTNDVRGVHFFAGTTGERKEHPMSKTSFVSTVALNDEGPFATFKEALTNFIERMRKLVSEGTSLQIVETCCFITAKHYRGEIPMLFYDVRDFAHQVGLMRDGKLVPDAPEPDASVIGKIFAVSMIMGEAEMLVRDT